MHAGRNLNEYPMSLERHLCLVAGREIGDEHHDQPGDEPESKDGYGRIHISAGGRCQIRLEVQTSYSLCIQDFEAVVVEEPKEY